MLTRNQKGFPMLKKTWTALCALMIVAGVLVGAPGCRNVENALDCRGICDRYKDCYDHNYNTDDCHNRCEDKANDNKDFMRKVDACNDCLGDKSCASATFTCLDECGGIVP
jgi:hypothetical protein